jgi:hypothetical protein
MGKYKSGPLRSVSICRPRRQHSAHGSEKDNDLKEQSIYNQCPI